MPKLTIDLSIEEVMLEDEGGAAKLHVEINSEPDLDDQLASFLAAKFGEFLAKERILEAFATHYLKKFTKEQIAMLARNEARVEGDKLIL